jgi:hypothetical protein
VRNSPHVRFYRSSEQNAREAKHSRGSRPRLPPFHALYSQLILCFQVSLRAVFSETWRKWRSWLGAKFDAYFENPQDILDISGMNLGAEGASVYILSYAVCIHLVVYGVYTSCRIV